MVACSKEQTSRWSPAALVILRVEAGDDQINVIAEEANKSKIESLIKIDSTQQLLAKKLQHHAECADIAGKHSI